MKNVWNCSGIFFFFQFAKAYIHWLNKIHHEKNIFYTYIHAVYGISFFLALGISMAIATFVESSYGTPVARALVYRTWWFELLWALFALNLVNNFIRFRLYTKEKLTMGIFHVSFILMLLGAVITRYVGYEGLMHIREGERSDYILSREDYFTPHRLVTRKKQST